MGPAYQPRSSGKAFTALRSTKARQTMLAANKPTLLSSLLATPYRSGVTWQL
jgi:hypothetical protein